MTVKKVKELKVYRKSVAVLHYTIECVGHFPRNHASGLGAVMINRATSTVALICDANTRDAVGRVALLKDAERQMDGLDGLYQAAFDVGIFKGFDRHARAMMLIDDLMGDIVKWRRYTVKRHEQAAQAQCQGVAMSSASVPAPV